MRISQSPVSLTDAQGLAQLTVTAVTQTTDLVEAMHLNIASARWPFGPAREGRTHGITGLVYRSIREITGLVGKSIDAVLAPFAQWLPTLDSSPEREAVLAALNGVLGDHLEASGNPLAIRMSLRQAGRTLPLEREALADAVHAPRGKLLVMVHGLCMNDLQWQRKGHDHGAALAEAFGYSVLYLHYNSGRHISSNGREFAAVLETLLQQWPVTVDELVIVGHSMGGLVTRSAWHYAQQAQLSWPARLRRMFFLGSPHQGAPLERHGNRLQRLIANISPYVAPLARLGMLRSAGITDLRHGSLLDEDWAQTNRFSAGYRREPLALPPVPCYAMAVSLGQAAGDIGDCLLADGLVPVSSALGEHPDPAQSLDFPAARRWVAYGLSHWDLLDAPAVHDQLAAWFAQGGD